MYVLHLKAVDSREATQEELDAAQITPDQIRPGWRIMAHQAATVRALRFGTAPIVINPAMTGDGKTLAGQFRLFADRIKTLTMYPTNELVADQRRGLDALLHEWTPPQWTNPTLRITSLNAVALDDRQSDFEDTLRTEAVEKLLKQDLLLTNPDVFHLMMQFGYRRYGAARDLILGEVINRYSLFVFDEFHVFGAAQTASALIAILLALQIGSTKNPPRFLFLSATPQSLLSHLTRKVGLEVETIPREYQHGQPSAPAGYRRILRGIDLYLYSGKLDVWVTDYLEDVIIAFFARNRSGARGVIIANSIATAYRIRALITDACQKSGIEVGINTGLTPKDKRMIDVDLLVATSTVDVGVDFRVNLLIFESMDAASHIQRLGRLGRHADDGKGHPFVQFEAHALLPPWVVEALSVKLPTESTVDRENYTETLNLEEVYPPLQHFDAYIKQWAGVQAAHVIRQLAGNEIKTQYESFRSTLSAQYKVLFPGGNPVYVRLLHDEQDAILKEAISFRGGSPFTALVIDLTDDSRTVMSYDLLTLLRNGDLKAVDLETILEQSKRHGQNAKSLERTRPLAAYELRGWLSELRPIGIYVDRELDITRFDTVIEQTGFRLESPDVPELHALNEALEQRTLVAHLCLNEKPDSLRRRLRIGLQLDLLPFHSADGSEGCVAFARDALLLDSILFRARKPNDYRPLIL